MAYTIIPPQDPGAGTVAPTDLTGFTVKRIPFGSAATALEDVADLTYDKTTHDLTLSVAESGGTVGATLTNSSNTASSDARYLINSGGTSAGDAVLQWGITGGQQYTIGVDNSVSGDPLVLSVGTALGTTDVYSINASGEMNMGTGIPVSGEKFHVRTAGDTDVGVETTATANKATVKAIAGVNSVRMIQYGSTASGSTDGVSNANLGVIQTAGTGTKILLSCPNSADEIIFACNGAVVARINGSANFLLGTATSVASTRFRIDASKSVASAAGAVWDGIDSIAPTLTLSGSTNITTATGVNAMTLRGPTITAASALTVTAASTLYIAAAPAGAGAGPATLTNAYSIWVDAGLTRFDGNGTQIFELPADATAGVAVIISGRIPVKIGGATMYLRYYTD